MERENTTKPPIELYKALSAFQKEVPIIHEGSENKFSNYTYADLATIFTTINPILETHGLGFTQLVEGKSIRTVVFHTETGQSIECVIDIPQGIQMKGMNDFHVLGSAITYIRRYAISSILGLVTDKDNDGHGEQLKGNKPSPQDTKRFTCKKTGLIQPNGANWFNPLDKNGNINKSGELLLKRAESEEIQDILDGMHESGFKMNKTSWEWLIKEIGLDK